MGALDAQRVGVVHQHQGWRLISFRIGFLYLTSGFGGSLLSALFIQYGISVGASGALFGLLGSMLSELISNWTIFRFLSTVSSMAYSPFHHHNKLSSGNSTTRGQLCSSWRICLQISSWILFLIRPLFKWLTHRNAPPGRVSTLVKSKHNTYQYVLWVLSLILLIVGYTLFQVVNLNNHCSWCHYLSSVPTSKWNCKSQNIYCLALVYEYMEKGSLERWLHPPTDIEEAREAPKSLNLLQRLSISIDVACFILVDYLHNHSETPIVHCDLKPSTVLLDNMSTGHVSDFD